MKPQTIWAKSAVQKNTENYPGLHHSFPVLHRHRHVRTLKVY